MAWSFETSRLLVEPWGGARAAPGFAAALGAILSPAVVAPLPPGMHDLSDLGAWADALEQAAQVTTIRTRGDGALIGLLILTDAPEGTHIGYLLAEAAWGRGLGTEVLRGAVAAARGRRLLAGVARTNGASIRILEKAGFVEDPAAGTPDTAQYRHPAPGPSADRRE